MKSRSLTLTLGFFAAFCFAVLPGCEDSTTTTVTETTDSHQGHDDDGDHAEQDHDGNHSFESLADAVTEIESLRDTIRDEFAAGDADVAHEPLHHIGEVLLATEELIAKMDPSDQKTAAAAAVESLLDDFTAVDQGMHGSDENKSNGKKYDEVSKSIDEAIATLKKDAE